MAKRVIILTQHVVDKQLRVEYVCWYPVKGDPVPANHGSAWSGRSKIEDLAIQEGTVIEEQGILTLDVGASLAEIENELSNIWNTRQAELVPMLDFYGIFLDEQGWSK